jgi:hypothetical protein
MRHCIAALGIALILPAVFPSISRAQSGTPRAYGLTPVGATTVFVNLTGSTTETNTDSNLSLPNNEFVNRSAVATILYSFPLGERYGGLAMTGGQARVRSSGPSHDEETTGWVDPSITFHVNFFGGPALTRDQYASFIPETYSTFHLTINAPLGAYDRNSPLNSGANRWAISPLINYSITPDKGVSWIDLYAGAQIYTANDEYQGGKRLTQSPLVTLTAYYSHNIISTIWAGIGAYYRNGGGSSINGVSQDNALSVVRPSAAVSAKLGQFRFTLRFDSQASDSKTQSGLFMLQISSPPF